MANIKIEYSRDNRFPFHSVVPGAAIIEDNPEDSYELNFIFDKLVEKFPELAAENFYKRVVEINGMKPSNEQVKMLKAASDKLLKNIRNCLADEAFIHQMNDKYGFGVSKVISTLYAVYGYYFYTGKRTANVIKKTLDGYKKQPVY